MCVGGFSVSVKGYSSITSSLLRGMHQVHTQQQLQQQQQQQQQQSEEERAGEGEREVLGGVVLMSLEGGYEVEGLASSVTATLSSLLFTNNNSSNNNSSNNTNSTSDEENIDEDGEEEEEVNEEVLEAIQRVKRQLAPHWSCFASHA